MVKVKTTNNSGFSLPFLSIHPYQELLEKIRKIIKDVAKEDMAKWELEYALEEIDDLIIHHKKLKGNK